jgi:hypothetical protein
MQYMCLIYDDEALGIAARIPSARYGSIEVRPVVVWEE